MREIKFRAFIKGANIILDGVTVYGSGLIGYCNDDLQSEATEAGHLVEDDCITDQEGNHLVSYLPGDDWVYFDEPNFSLMQYTGLKDKNGTDVYEGDRLGHIHDKRLLIWEVQFINGVFGIVNINGDHKSNFFPCDGSKYYFSDRVIIGNIYETPENPSLDKDINATKTETE